MPVDRIIANARALIGTPFRLHGRDPETGIDCVGLVAIAYDRPTDAPTGYAIRNSLEARWLARLDALLPRRIGRTQPADVTLFAAGPAQFHLGLWTGDSLIHADAGIGKVVELMGTPPWPLIASWHKLKDQ